MQEHSEQRAITEALNRIDSFAVLGRNPLAQSRLIGAELARAGTGDTPFQRGRVLSRLIRQEARKQFEEREAQPRGRDVAEWSILYLRVHDGLSLQEIAGRLAMPLRSVARYYGRAKDLLLDRLYALEEQIAVGGLYCPLCGASLEGLHAEAPATRVCPVCGAHIEITFPGTNTVEMVASTGTKHIGALYS